MTEPGATALGGSSAVAEYALSDSETEQISALTHSLSELAGGIDDGNFLARMAVFANELPRGLRLFMEGFRTADRSPACLVHGYPVDETRIGPSPIVYNCQRDKSGDEIRLELAATLLSSCIGDVFGWRLQHDGSIIHDLAPRPEHEDLGFGTGSLQHINWHTEDAFHPCRADYIALFCMRNSREIPTTIGFLDHSLLSERHRQLLFAMLFTFRPDPSYLIAETGPVPGADRGSVLFGDPADPYLRFDQDYVDWPSDLEGVSEAVSALREAIDENLIDLPLRSGDFLVLDNQRAVHGRPAFTPVYQGADRWLKRLNITRDLRRSRHLRRSALDRLIRV
jgi:Fe(II)/alpha-ketoglutarate-dependent arginine beta-hydroxylase